jgi:hypothetical protein
MGFRGATQDIENTDLEGVYFIGKVVVNDDPKKMERVKVSIPDIFEGDPTNFPWVSPKKAGWFPNTADFGVFGLVPPIGTEINVFFQRGNPLYPMYDGYPHQLDERVNDFVTNYLKRYGWKDPQGNLFFIDTTDDVDPQVKFQHVSGFVFTVNHNGDFWVTTPGKSNFHSDDDMSFSTGGAMSFTSEGAMTQHSDTSITDNAPRIDHTN